MRSLSNTSWWPGSALVAVAVNLRMTGFASMGVEELLMTVRWGSIHCFDLLLLFLELIQYFVQLRVLKEELLPEGVLHAVLFLGLCIWISFDFLVARALVTLSTLFSVYVASGMIVNWGMLPLASSCRCLSSVCINTSAALRFKKKKKKTVCISWNCWHLGVVTNVTTLHPKYMNQIFGYNFPTLIAIDTFWFESLV